MEIKYKLKFLPLFYEDLDRITDYMEIYFEDLKLANNFIDTLEEAIKKRACNPTSFERYISKGNVTYYRIYVKNYTVFYTVQNDVMEVRRILYSKRNFKKLI